MLKWFVARTTQAHPSLNKLKVLPWSYVLCPKMDSDIEAMVKDSSICQGSQPLLPVAPSHPWEWPTQPWSGLHLDFAGMFLVLVDDYLKWIEVHTMQSIKSAKQLRKFGSYFQLTDYFTKLWRTMILHSSGKSLKNLWK